MTQAAPAKNKNPNIEAVRKLRTFVGDKKRKQVSFDKELAYALLTMLDDMKQVVYDQIESAMSVYDGTQEGSLFDSEEAAYEAACAVDGLEVDWPTFYDHPDWLKTETEVIDEVPSGEPPVSI